MLTHRPHRYHRLAAALLTGLLAFQAVGWLAEGGTKPLDHIPPVYGRIGARWHTARATAEAFVLWNGQKKIEDYSLNGEDNEQYAPADGMSAWTMLNLRGGYRFNRFLGIQAGLDNILDTQYRAFASGINGAGRNLFVTLRVGF